MTALTAVVWFILGAAVGAAGTWVFNRMRPPHRVPDAGGPDIGRRRLELGRLVGVLVILLALFSFGQATVQQRATERLQECMDADRHAMARLVRRLIAGEDGSEALADWLAETERIAERCAP